jgi:hypothetical protein
MWQIPPMVRDAEQHIKQMQEFQTREDDILFCTCPKSGNKEIKYKCLFFLYWSHANKMKNKNTILSEHMRWYPVCSGVSVTQSLVLCVCFVNRCLFFCTFFIWPLCCLFFFDARILVTPLVSSNSSSKFPE